MSLPENVDPGATVMLSGSTFNAILDEIRRITIHIDDENSPLSIREQSVDGGTVLGIDTTTC
jgi:hypothetical protein